MSTRPLLAIAGLVCLALGAFMLYKQAPRENQPPPAWMQSDVGSTTVALGSFSLLILGISLIVKGV